MPVFLSLLPGLLRIRVLFIPLGVRFIGDSKTSELFYAARKRKDFWRIAYQGNTESKEILSIWSGS